ncbi:hypothetical protein Goarm_000492, partial [Gossypium armourianum]|nr:hypothetical protein [Gossypium armourianum]
HHDCLADIYTTTDRLSLRQTFPFNLHILENECLLHQILFPTFRRLRINTTSVGYHSFIHEILQRGRRMPHWVLSRGINCKVLPLRSVIQACIVEHCNDGILMGRALAEPASEFENSNYGMVPAKESLVKEMLERVRVEARDEEDCMICLEVLEVGFDASRMPCSHTFHALNYVKEWKRKFTWYRESLPAPENKPPAVFAAEQCQPSPRVPPKHFSRTKFPLLRFLK